MSNRRGPARGRGRSCARRSAPPAGRSCCAFRSWCWRGLGPGGARPADEQRTSPSMCQSRKPLGRRGSGRVRRRRVAVRRRQRAGPDSTTATANPAGTCDTRRQNSMRKKGAPPRQHRTRPRRGRRCAASARRHPCRACSTTDSATSREAEERLRRRRPWCWCAPTELTGRWAPAPRPGGCPLRWRAGSAGHETPSPGRTGTGA
jgi:hypothetical protein